MINKIKDFAEVVNGSTPSTKHPEYYDGDIIWITPKDLSDQKSKYIYKGERTISKEGYKSCSTKMIPENNILMSSRAPIGLLAINKISCCTNQGFKSLIVNKTKCDVEYLYYYLKYHIKEIELLGSGTTFKEVSKESFENYIVNLPSLDRQHKIAKLLIDIDNKIIINNRINDNLQQLAENYFDRWFLQFDFPVNNKPYKSSGGMMIYNEILKTNIPSNWEVINIKSICELIWGQCPDGKNILNLNDDTANTLLYCSGAGDMRNGLVVDCQARTNASKREAEAGDILMSVAGSIGALCICDKHISLGRAAVAFRTNKDYLAFCYFMIKKYINRMLSVSSGSIQKVVNDSHIDDINFAFNKEIINDFTFVNDIINKCVLLAKENSELIKLRNELLPLLMNGQVSIV